METKENVKRVLVVDDNEDTLRLVRMAVAIKYADIEVITAKTSREAISKFNGQAFHGLILDVSLPDVTGAYLGSLFRKYCPLIPMAFLTNYNGEVTRENAQVIDAEFWYKPNLFSDFNKLADKINALLEGASCEYLNNIPVPSIIEDNGE